MRSELFRIPFEIAGVPIFGLGILLALWLIGSVVFVVWQLRRQPVEGQAVSLQEVVLGFGPLIAGVAAAIYFLPQLFAGGIPIRGYGVMLLTASVTGLAMAVHRARQHGIDPDTIFSITFWMFVFGILGARLFFVIEYWDVAFAGDTFFQRLMKAVTFTEGGLVVYGSLIGAAGAFVFRCWSQKLPVLAIADIMAPSLAIGLAIGRVGCLLNGCCFGGPCEAPWAVTFPRYHSSSSDQPSPPYGDQVTRGEMHGIRLAVDERENPPRVVVAAVRDESLQGVEVGSEVTDINGLPINSFADASGAMLTAYDFEQRVVIIFASGKQAVLPAAKVRQRSLPVHPTQIYSAVNAALLSWFAWSFYPLRRRDGEVIGLLLTIYPISRFLLEIIRTDESSFFKTGLSISQNVSVLILVGIGVYWLWLLRRPRQTAYSFA